jgi:hypothetical protein
MWRHVRGFIEYLYICYLLKKDLEICKYKIWCFSFTWLSCYIMWSWHMVVKLKRNKHIHNNVCWIWKFNSIKFNSSLLMYRINSQKANYTNSTTYKYKSTARRPITQTAQHTNINQQPEGQLHKQHNIQT